MEIKRKKQLILFACLIGIYFFILHYFELEHERKILSFLLLGIAFIYLYKSKNKDWALLMGGIVVVLGIGRPVLNIPMIGKNLFVALLLMILGLFLLWDYFKYKNENYLVPGCFMVWAGGYVLLIAFSFFRLIACTLLCICLGMVFISAYFLGKCKISTWIIAISILLFIVGFLFMAGNYAVTMPMLIVVAGLILFSAIVFAKAIQHKL